MKKIAYIIALAMIGFAWTESESLTITDTYSFSTTETIIILTGENEATEIAIMEKLPKDRFLVSQTIS